MKFSSFFSRRLGLTLAVMAVVAVGVFLLGAPVGAMPLHTLYSPADFSTAAALGFGGLTLNKGNLTILNQSFNAAFKQGMATVSPMWNRIAMEVPSTTGEEKYGWLGKSTKFREWIGDRQYQNLKVHDYTIKNKTFENTVEVDREDIEDDQYGIYNMPMQLLGEDAALHPDELVFSLLSQGFTTKCYDGQPFFDTDHPVGPQGAQVSVSNNGGGAGTPWFLLNVGRLIRPIIYQKRRGYNFVSLTSPDDPNVFTKNKFVYGADGRSNVGFGLWQMGFGSKQTLDEAGYTAARAAMFNFKFDNGKPVNQAGKFLLVVPPGLENAALKCVQAERLANGADNVYKGTAEVFVCPWLS